MMKHICENQFILFEDDYKNKNELEILLNKLSNNRTHIIVGYVDFNDFLIDQNYKPLYSYSFSINQMQKALDIYNLLPFIDSLDKIMFTVSLKKSNNSRTFGEVLLLSNKFI